MGLDSRLASFVRHNLDSAEGWSVVADHLLELGDPRGDLIRIEQAVAALPMGPERDLQVAAWHGCDEACRPLRGGLDPGPLQVEWKHGFAVGIWMPATPAAHARLLDWLSAHPTIGRLSIHQGVVEDRAVASVLTPEVTARSTELTLLGRPTKVGWRRIGEALMGASLVSIDLSRCGNHSVMFDVLRGQDGPLRKLDLTGCEFGTDGASALGELGLRVQHLVLAHCRLAGPDVALLQPLLRSATTLDLSHNSLGGFLRTFDDGAFGAATSLSLRGTFLGPDDASELSRLVSDDLASLGLAWSSLGPEGMRSLPCSEGLRELDVSDANHDDATVRALTTWPALPRLRRLDLGYNPLGDASLRALAEAPFRDLETLCLGHVGGNHRLPEWSREAISHLCERLPPSTSTIDLGSRSMWSMAGPGIAPLPTRLLSRIAVALQVDSPFRDEGSNRREAWVNNRFRLVEDRSGYVLTGHGYPGYGTFDVFERREDVKRHLASRAMHTPALGELILEGGWPRTLIAFEHGRVVAFVPLDAFQWLRSTGGIPEWTKWRHLEVRALLADQASLFQIRLDVHALVDAVPEVSGPRLARGEVVGLRDLPAWPDVTEEDLAIRLEPGPPSGPTVWDDERVSDPEAMDHLLGYPEVFPYDSGHRYPQDLYWTIFERGTSG